MPLLEIKSLDEIELSVNKSSAQTKIPKNIFQTWETEEVPEIVYERVQKMKEENPDWKYFFFNSDLRRDFIQRHFDQSVLYAYDNLIPGAYKVDLWQFCILSKFGGLYLDMKCMPLVKINQIVDSSSTFIASRDRYLKEFAGDFYIICGYLASRANHDFLKKAIELIIYNVRNGILGTDRLLPTGPGLLGRAINYSLNVPEKNTILPGIKKHKREYYSIFPVADFQENCVVNFEHNKIIDLGYGEVYDSLCFPGSLLSQKNRNYAELWRTGRIYNHKKYQLSIKKKIEIKLNLIGLYIDCCFQYFKSKISN